MSEQKLPITGLVVGTVSPAVLVCGDPSRADKIAAHLTEVTLLSQQREYRAYKGVYNNIPLTICSHGVGAPGAAIAFEELIAAGGRAFIRVGTCGGLQPDIVSGDLVIATAAVQATGYGREMVPLGYPAVADLDLTLALRQAAQRAQRPVRTGLVLTRDSFYGGLDTWQTPHYPTMAAAQVLAVEMECAALFIVGSLRGVQTGAILAVDGNVLEAGESMEAYNPHQTVVAEAVTAEIEIALQALQGWHHDGTF